MQQNNRHRGACPEGRPSGSRTGSEGASGPLGTLAKSAANLPPDPAAAARLERFELQGVARKLLPAERVSSCLRGLVPGAPGVRVLHSPERGSAHYGNLMVCSSVWHCPVCAAKISERRREELAAGIAAAKERELRVLLVTYTFSHTRSDDLSDILGPFLAAQRSMVGNRPYKRLCASYGVVGSIKSLEVTWGQANGWHPHAHVLLFVEGDVADLPSFERDLYACWSGAAARHGLTMDAEHGLDVRATWGSVEDYVSKWGHAPAARPWGTEDELVKAHSKRARADRDGERYTPFDLLRWLADTGESQAAALFREYATVFKGRRQLVWSPGLRALLGLDVESSDEDLAQAAVEDAVLIAMLTFEQWRAVRRLEQRGQLLEVARSGDATRVWAFVERCVELHLSGGAARSP